jgi:hypothetical protein
MDEHAHWLSAAAERLRADGFEIREDVDYEGERFRLVAHRSRFEFSKFGNSEYFFVFAEIHPLTEAELQGFQAEAFDYAMANKKSNRPCGWFEAVWCFPVAMTSGLDEGLARLVGEQAPPKHWAAAEVPVVYDGAAGTLTYFRKTPIWGSAYWRGFRKLIRRYLAGEQV